MELALWILVFVVSVAVLVKASDYFVSAAETVGIWLGAPPFLVGVILVGVGTSLPELVSSILAVTSGASEIVVGNVLGSNIANLLLVLGIAALLSRHLSIEYDMMRLDIPCLAGSTVLLTLMLWDNRFSTGEAFICLFALTAYVMHAFRQPSDENGTSNRPGVRTWLRLALSPVFIFLGAKYTIDSVIAISAMLHVGSEVVALTAVSLGTSLPEVLVTISAARRGQAEMAVGNVMGSNIFNTFAVMGIPALLGPLAIPDDITGFALPVFVLATLLVIIIALDKHISRWEGCMLLLFYVFFVGQMYGLL